METTGYCIENDRAAQMELAEMERHNSLLIWKENKALRARVAKLEEALRFVFDECDWEDDKRIGAAARRALEEK